MLSKRGAALLFFCSLPAGAQTLEPSLLERFGLSVERAQALPPAERKALAAHLRDLESGRQYRLTILRRARPGDWRSLVDEKGLLTKEGEQAVDAWLADAAAKGRLVPARIDSFERADGKPLTDADLGRAQAVLDRLFDGVASTPREKLGSALVVNARVRGNYVGSITLSNPASGWSAEVGQLGGDPRDPQVARSWYGNLEGAWDSKPESWVDYRVKAQLGYVQLRARIFPDAADPRPARVVELAQRLGLPDDKARELSQYVTYNDETVTQGIIVTSLLAELGRAYHLAGPVDVSWAAGSLTRVLWYAPNQAFDETLGLRVRLADGLSVGVFGGASQNLSPVGTNLFQEALAKSTIKPGLYVENAPHAAVAIWGKVPGLSDVRFQLTGSQRWNSNTVAQKAEATILTQFHEHPLALRGSYEREKGTSIEFQRDRARVEIEYGISERASAFLAYERDNVKYGNAKVNSDSFLLGAEIKLGSGGSSLSYEQLIGSRSDESPEAQRHFKDALEKINRGIVDGAQALDRAVDAYDAIRGALAPAELETRLNALSLALSRLDPLQAESLFRELTGRGLSDGQRSLLSDLWLRTISPSSPLFTDLKSRIPELSRLDDAARYWKDHRGDVLELARLLTDETVWNAALINAGRAQLLKALNEHGTFDVPIGGCDLKIKLDAASLLASANVINSRLSPVAPIAEGEIEPALLREAGKHLGLSGEVTPEMITARVFQMAEERFKAELERRLSSLAAQIGPVTSADASAKLLAALPPEAAAELRRRYGDNLQNLIPQNVSAEQLKQLIGERVPKELAEFLAKRYGVDLAQGVAAMTTWAAELVRRELNMQMIRLLLASEQLNRLTVDRGRKIDDLELRFAIRSFAQLDARDKPRVTDRIKDLQLTAAGQAEKDESRLVARLETQGRAQLAALQLDPAWPEGLRVRIDEKSLAPLLAYYGDGELFDLLRRIADKHKTLKKKQLTLELSYAEPKSSLGGGTSIRDPGDGKTIGIELSRPKDARDAALRLSYLADYIK